MKSRSRPWDSRVPSHVSKFTKSAKIEELMERAYFIFKKIEGNFKKIQGKNKVNDSWCRTTVVLKKERSII